MVRIISTLEAESLDFQGFQKSIFKFLKVSLNSFFPSDGTEIWNENAYCVIMEIIENIRVGIQSRVDIPVAEPGLEDYGPDSWLDAAGREGVP